MSDDCINTIANKKDTKIIVSNENGMISPFQYQRAAHWIPASNNLAPQGHKASNIAYAKGKGTCVSNQEYLQVRNNKSTKLKMVRVGDKHESVTEYKNTCNCKLEFRLDSHPVIDIAGGDNENVKVEKSFSTKVFKSSDTELVSETQSLVELPGVSDHYRDHEACSSRHSEDVISHMDVFPMYGINQKIQNTVNSRKYLARNHRSVTFASQLLPREARLNTSIIKFTAEELHSETGEARIPQEIESLKFIECLSPCLLGGTRSSLSISSDTYKIHNTSIGPSKWGKEKLVYVDSEYVSHDHPLKTGSANMNHELCDSTDHSSWKLCEVEKDNNLIANEVKCSRMKRSMEAQRYRASDGLTLSSLGRDHDEALPNGSRKYRQHIYKPFHGLTNFNVPKSAQTIGKAPNSSLHDTETKIKDATCNFMDNADGEFNISSDMICNKSTTTVTTKFREGEQAIEYSADLSKSRGTAFFEMLTEPRSHVKQYGFSQISETGSGTRFERHNAGSSKSARRTDTMSIDSYRVPKSLQVTISSSQKKDHLFCNLANSHSASVSPVKPDSCASPKAKLPDASENKKEMSESTTQSLNQDQVLSHVQRPHSSNSTSITENIWLMRLGPNTSDSGGIKRLKVGHGPSTGQPHHPSAEALAPNISGSSMMDPQMEQISDQTKQLQRDHHSSSGVSDKQINTWMQRWCRKNPQTTQPQIMEADSLTRGTESLEQLPEQYKEKQFPSIAALAMMGRAMNNLRTRTFQRRGSSVVWKTEGLL